MALKAFVLWCLALTFKIKNSDRWLFSLSLAQAGEFGFVLLSFTVQNHVIPKDIAAILQLVVALSMFLTPVLFILFEKVILPKYQQQSNDREFDDIEEESKVIIAGAGRFGQIITRLLAANGFKAVVLDHEAGQIENLRKIKIKSYFGDATRPEMLHTAGIEQSDVFVVAIDNREEAVELVHYVKQNFPQVKVLARSFDKGHSHELKLAGADYTINETYHSALQLGGEVMRTIGYHPFSVEQKMTTFCKTEYAASESLYQEWAKRSEGEKYSHDHMAKINRFRV